MIGIGTWRFKISTLVFSGEITLQVFDDGGKYGYKLRIPGIKVPPIEIIEVKEDENTVDATVQTTLLPGKNILIHAEFDGDTVEGYIKAPIVGKVKIKDGRRIG